jgi:hypothetical protein
VKHAVATALFVTTCGVASADEVPERKFGMTRMFGLTVGQPLGLSVSAGVIIGTVPAKPVKCGLGYWSDGVFLQAEPGIGGGKISVGAATSNSLFGMAVKASAVRTWGKTWGTDPGATYLGGELEFVAIAKVSAGWLWKTGPADGKRSLFTWGLGLGF